MLAKNKSGWILLEHLNIKERRKIINKMVAFTRQLDISFKCF